MADPARVALIWDPLNDTAACADSIGPLPHHLLVVGVSVVAEGVVLARPFVQFNFEHPVGEVLLPVQELSTTCFVVETLVRWDWEKVFQILNREVWFQQRTTAEVTGT